jgi:hypothetical protein
MVVVIECVMGFTPFCSSILHTLNPNPFFEAFFFTALYLIKHLNSYHGRNGTKPVKKILYLHNTHKKNPHPNKIDSFRTYKFLVQSLHWCLQVQIFTFPKWNMVPLKDLTQGLGWTLKPPHCEASIDHEY